MRVKYCSLNKSILLLIAVCTLNVNTLWTEFEFVTINNSNDGILKSILRISRYNKTAYGISGTVEFMEDIKDNYDCEIKIYSSPKGNNQYTLLPYKVARSSCCKFFENFYWKTVEKALATRSDVPIPKGKERSCDLYVKGIYTVRELPFDRNVIPKFMDAGTYKVEIYFYQKSEVLSVANTIVRLY